MSSQIEARDGFEETLARSNLSARQLLIYAGQRLAPDTLLYDVVYRVRWPALDVARFGRAWQALLDASDALRMIIVEVDGVPRQHVLPAFPCPLECIDLRDGEAGSGRAVEAWVTKRIERPLDLRHRAFDTALLRTGDSEFTWFLNLHHVIADAAAVEIIVSTVVELYESGASRPPVLPSFADYLQEQRRLRDTSEYAVARRYWQAVLSGVPESPALYGIAAARSTHQERVVLALGARTSRAIEGLARRQSTHGLSSHAAASNLFAAVLAAFLARIGGVERVGIGATAHNRSSERERSTIGLLMEIFPLVIAVRPTDSLASLAADIGNLAREAWRHRAVSVGNRLRQPAYAALLNYMRPLRPPPAQLEIQRVHPGHGAHAISVSVAPHAGDRGYEIWVDVNAEIAAMSSASRVAGHFRTLLEAAVADPQAPLSTLPLLPASERRTLLECARGPLQARDRRRQCHRTFEEQVARTPDATAVVAPSGHLSYRELNQRANSLARRLRNVGVRRGHFVCLYLERSLEAVVAILAVLKSGAAYVPLDVQSPWTRTRSMLDDTAPTAVLTTAALRESLPPNRAEAIYVDARESPGADGPDLDPYGNSSDVAYVLYTSGSSGAPKGVLVTHGNVENHLAWRTSHFALTADDRCLQNAPLGFDDSVWQILEPLNAGACVVLARSRFEYDSAYLAHLLRSERVTIACFVPSLLRSLLQEPELAQCVDLRRLSTGGEVLPVSVQRQVHAVLPRVALYNGYGATETTIASTFWKCRDLCDQTSVPIGRPIANTQVYVLDPAGEPVPPGVTGEIWIGGAGVARGYLNRRSLTAERFRQDPFGNGRTLYRTGDLGRLRADGALEFGGRLDEQVKIRGLRVELGEIEAALCAHTAVSSAAVVCADSPTQPGRLIAHVVPRQGSVPAPNELREFLQTRLPSAMIPSAFVHATSLPLTASGKLDRRGLLESSSADELDGRYAPPRNETEATIVRLWEHTLNARPIGIRDDFFSIGGHSLLAVQVAASIEAQLGRPMSPDVIFEAPTVELLAARLSRAEQRTTGPLVCLSSGGPETPLTLVHYGSGTVASYRGLARLLSSERSVYGLEAGRLRDGSENAIETLAARYVEALRAAQPCGPYALAGHSAGGFVAFEMAQQLQRAGEHVALLAIVDTDADVHQRRRLSDIARFQLATLTRMPMRNRLRYLSQRIPRWISRLHQGGKQPAPAAGEPAESTWAKMNRAVAAYQLRPYAGAITLLRAEDRRATGTYSRHLGWDRLTRDGVRAIALPGDHDTLMHAEHVPHLADALRRCFVKTRAPAE